MRTILVKHGETDWEIQKKLIGFSDEPLNERGIKQAELLAKRLSRENFTAVYSSPLQRASYTAELIAKECNLKVVYYDDLKEFNFGKIEGMLYKDLVDFHTTFVKAWEIDPTECRAPRGEVFFEFQARVWKCVGGILKASYPNVVVIVCHVLAVRALICKTIGLALSNFHKLTLKTPSLSYLDFDGKDLILTL
ncbi:MAG: histidine phosphatase family protein [Planctomycetota bacterium]